ncbi:MAG: hypothetical protein WC783_00620 [Candidatus Paceibacterota bacterium]|jgi:hypothetical protein
MSDTHVAGLNCKLKIQNILLLSIAKSLIKLSQDSPQDGIDKINDLEKQINRENKTISG